MCSDLLLISTCVCAFMTHNTQNIHLTQLTKQEVKDCYNRLFDGQAEHEQDEEEEPHVTEVLVEVLLSLLVKESLLLREIARDGMVFSLFMRVHFCLQCTTCTQEHSCSYSYLCLYIYNYV